MAILPAKYKRFNGLDWDEFYFETTIGQVINLQATLNSKLNASAKGETANKTLTFGGTFKVLETLANGTVNERTMTMPANPNTDTNNYLTGVSGSGNGTVTFTRNGGLSNLTWDASHTHTIAQVTGLQGVLDGKAPLSHNHPISQITNLRDELDDKANLSGATFTGNINTTSITNTYYAQNVLRFGTTSTPVQTVIYTKIKYQSGTHMPVVRIYGYAYGLQSPIELKIGFYIFSGSLGWCGAVSMGAWRPEIFLFKYNEGGVDYVGIGLKGSVYYLAFQVDVQTVNMGTIGNSILINGWSSDTRSQAEVDASNTIIPPLGVDNCIQVPYKSTLSSLKLQFNGVTQSEYDGATPKTLNITPSAIGAKEASYTPSWSEVSDKPTWIGANKPTYDLGEISETTTYKRVTQSEKNTWSAKQNALGYTAENITNKRTSIRTTGADNTSYVSELGVKTYVDALIGSVYRPSGDWNASTNTPTLANSTPANAGKVYRVSVAGTQFGFTFAVGDKLAFNESGVISKWDNVDDVVSVNGQTGTVVLTTDNINQGSNLYVIQSEKNTWNAKQSAITGAATTITSSNLTASRTLISDSSGKVAVSAVTSTELGYLDGVTSSIQTQLNVKVAYKGLLGTTDLNTLNTGAAQGIYSQNANANATLARNYPTASAGAGLLRVYWTGANDGVIQEYNNYIDGKIYVRAYQGSTWSGWRTVATQDWVTSNTRSNTWTPAIGDLPTGTTGTTVALGNHTHSQYLTSNGITGMSNGQIAIASGATTIGGSRAIVDSTGNAALAAGTGIPTERDVYYGLATIEGATQSRAVDIKAPTAAGIGVPRRLAGGAWTYLTDLANETYVNTQITTALGDYIRSDGSSYNSNINIGTANPGNGYGFTNINIGRTMGGGTALSIWGDDIIEANLGFAAYGGISASSYLRLDGRDVAVQSNYTPISGNTTLSISHAGQFIATYSTANITITVPTNANVAFPVNTEIHIYRRSTGAANIAAQSGVTIESVDGKTSIANRYQAVTLKKISLNTWALIGALS